MSLSIAPRWSPWRVSETSNGTTPDSGELLIESPSLLAARLQYRFDQRQGEVSSAGINGMHFWTVDGEICLRELGAEAGVLESRRIDRALLRAVCGSTPSGQWTTYGDITLNIAEASGVPGAAQSVASVLATDESMPNAHRVLRASGRISPGFAATGGGGPEAARKRLEDGGLTFAANGTADPTRRYLIEAPAQAG